MALKSTQGLHDVPDRPRVIEQFGCVVMEVEDWIDGESDFPLFGFSPVVGYLK